MQDNTQTPNRKFDETSDGQVKEYLYLLMDFL